MSNDQWDDPMIVRRHAERLFAPGAPGKRWTLSMLVRTEIKKKVIQMARASGRTQAQEAEFLVERALMYDRLFGELTAEQIEQFLRKAGAEQAEPGTP